MSGARFVDLESQLWDFGRASLCAQQGDGERGKVDGGGGVVRRADWKGWGGKEGGRSVHARAVL